MNDVILRRAVLGDYEKVEKLAKEIQNYHIGLRKDIYKEVEKAIPIDRYQELIENQLILLAELNTNLVGYAILIVRENDSELMFRRKILFVDSIGVYEKYREQYVGAMLMTEAKRIGKQLGCYSVEANVVANNENALKFYKRHNFTEKTKRVECIL